MDDLTEEIVSLIEDMLRYSEIAGGTNRRALAELIRQYRLQVPDPRG